MAKQFYKVDDNGKLIRAPRVLRVDGQEITCPSDDTLRKYGYMTLADGVPAPEEREGMVAVVVRHEVRDGAIWPIYDYEPIPAEEAEVAE